MIHQLSSVQERRLELLETLSSEDMIENQKLQYLLKPSMLLCYTIILYYSEYHLKSGALD